MTETDLWTAGHYWDARIEDITDDPDTPRFRVNGFCVSWPRNDPYARDNAIQEAVDRMGDRYVTRVLVV